MKKINICFTVFLLILICLGLYYFSNYNKDTFSNKSTKYSTENVVHTIDDEKLSLNEKEVNSNIDENNITEEVKNYILSNQEDKVEADKIKWSEVFLDNLDIKSLYNKYISEGGDSNDLEGFAQYITINAPILSNWQELFKKELYEEYGEEVVSIEHIEGDLYQAKVKLGDKELPYVLVSARTGYFHG